MQFLANNRIGLILRTFAPRPEQVGKLVGDVTELVTQANELRVQDTQVFSRIDIMVAIDERYPDFDCGKSAEAIRERVFPWNDGGVEIGVFEVRDGDLFVGALNAGFALQAHSGIDYSMNLSHGVRSYLTPENMEAMLIALKSGALATGLAIEPFADSIMEGRLLDTCNIWSVESMLQVGLYDSRGAQPISGERRGWVCGWSEKIGFNDWTYETAGVEEMFPLIEMVKRFGPCIAPIKPKVAGEWTIPDDPATRQREEKKIKSKFERQVRAAMLMGVDLSFLRGGVMPQYRS